MPLIPYPNVPNVPGVPVLLRSLTVPTPGALLNFGAAGLAQSLFGSKIWGVFSADGSAALEPDSFVSIEYDNDNVVSNYPMEAGSFASYDKSANPYLCTIMMTIGADKATRTSFLAKVDKLCAGLDLLTLVTPEASYANANLQGYGYKRTSSSGLSLIQVTLRFVQIRLTAQSTSRNSNATDPSGRDAEDLGQLQIEPTDDQADLAEVTV